MTGDRYILDASVAVKWFLPEQDSDLARRLLAQSQDGLIELHAPEIILFENANVVWKHVRRSEISGGRAHEIIDEMSRAPVTIHATRTLLPNALDIGMYSDVAVYDAIYVALADLLDCRLITADDKLRRKLDRTGWSKRILWIADVQ